MPGRTRSISPGMLPPGMLRSYSNKRVDLINSPEYKAEHKTPHVELAPLPSCAQFLNVIESVFSGMARAIIHNSDYESLAACKAAIDRYFAERNTFFRANPKKAGRIIWG